MKKFLLLFVALLTTTTVFADDFIYDVMVIGGNQTEVNNLKSSYTAQGWTVVNKDLNAGCGSSSDYIYLLYRKGKDSLQNVNNKPFITDFLISDANGTAPDSIVYGRTYYLVPCDGGTKFKNSKGDLNCNAGGKTIHLYYARENYYDFRTVKDITFNNTQSGGVGTNSTNTGYDLNAGASGEYIYMHADKSQGWIIEKNYVGDQCIIKNFDGPKAAIPSIDVPAIIDNATVLGFSGFNFSGFTILESMAFFENTIIDWTPVLKNCTAFKHIVIKKANGDILSQDITPASMVRIPGYSFAGTAVENITFDGVTTVDPFIFENCTNLKTVTFNQSPINIDFNAFSNISASTATVLSPTQVSYPGSIEDWSPRMYMYSPYMVIHKSDSTWYCGWCGGNNDTSNNQLYWTLESNHLKINCATDIHDFYPQSQTITTNNWKSNLVKHLTLEHVYSLGASEFYNYDNLETVDVKSGLTLISQTAFYSCDNLKTVYLPSSVTNIKENAFGNCGSLTDIYFDGNHQQWSSMIRAGSWKPSDTEVHWHCTVTFNTNGHGTAPNPVSIQWSNEDKLEEPTAPTANGYNFLGWYTDAECTNQWDFSNEIPGDMTLYAKWEATKYAVNVNENIEHGTVTADKQTAAQGETVTLTVTPDNGYQLGTLAVMKGSTAVATTPGAEEGQYTFVMPNAAVTVNATFVEIPSVPGDVNGDGSVTTADVTCIYNYLLNADETFIDTCDVDGDGFITTVDITVIYNILLGNKK